MFSYFQHNSLIFKESVHELRSSDPSRLAEKYEIKRPQNE